MNSNFLCSRRALMRALVRPAVFRDPVRVNKKSGFHPEASCTIHETDPYAGLSLKENDNRLSKLAASLRQSVNIGIKHPR